MNVTSILSWDAPHGRHLDSISGDRVARRQSTCRRDAAFGAHRSTAHIFAATCARSDVRKNPQRAISSVHPMHRNIVAKPTTVTQPTCVNTRQFVRTDTADTVVPCRENYRNDLSKSQHISTLRLFNFISSLSYSM